ncbi:MAG: hypothetical protein ACE147_09920 [Candidatus Methylomirabilales bacterium]
MTAAVWLLANTLSYPAGGGHRWVYLNWALGLRALGCEVRWVERVAPATPLQALRAYAAALRRDLTPHGLAGAVVLCADTEQPLAAHLPDGCQSLETAGEADLLLNLAYYAPSALVARSRRSAMVDIDPGLTQFWISTGQMRVSRHDLYFTIGETVGQPGARFPDCGLTWHYTPPPVFLPAWSVAGARPDAPYTTVTHWWGEPMEFPGESYYNGKRDGFFAFLDLPQLTPHALELAIYLGSAEEERRMLQKRGWRIADPQAVAATARDYRRYVRRSRGEFSCAKPSCLRLQNAWISDRTLCYLASGKPAVVQHTGPSRFLPDADGLFRFRSLADAARALSAAESGYERHCRLARALAEEYFDARKVIGRVVERALA